MDDHRPSRPSRETFPAPSTHAAIHALAKVRLVQVFEGIPLGDPSPLARALAGKVRA